MARKYSKGKKPKETMRQRQLRLRKEELARKKLVKTSRYTPVSQRVDKVKVKVEPQKQITGKGATKYLPASKKGGPLASTKGPRRRNITGNPSKGTQMGTKGSSTPQIKLPKATIRSAGAASKALSTTGKVAGRIAVPLSAYQTAKDLADSLKRGEGYARVPGLIKKLAEGSGTKTSGGSTNRRGRRKGPVPQSTKTATPKKRLANIPPAEAKPGSPSYVKPKSSTETKPSTKTKPSTSTPTANKPAAPKAKGTKTQQELQGTTEFIKNFSNKEGMERAVEQAKKRRDRLRKKLNMKIRSDSQKTQNRSAA